MREPDSQDGTLRAWRNAQRDALVAARLQVDAVTLRQWRDKIDLHLQQYFADLGAGVIAFCWPIKNEYDARPLAKRLREQGAVTALPVVVAPRTPLEFRAWHPGIELVRGALDIPYSKDGKSVLPDTILAPMNGFDAAGFRLGYGAGFFDRTLAALPAHPRTIGIAYEMARLATIRPQPYDIPMDFVVTERALYRRINGVLVETSV
ncbi:MAG: 5-formyltetrahydrofolate cyclo-ligase [Betaproteobacteria bacterium]|nr:5-formyltetrahydrofolate cyclo-ligase [Betaproteobacteria bacterium]